MLKPFIIVSVLLSFSVYATDISILKSQAQANNVQAQYALALAYQQGDNTTKDLTQALVWFEKAAQQGDTNAMQQVVNAYEKGKGTDKNPQQVRYWLTLLALKGATHAPLQLGDYYASLKTERLPASAFAELWYKIASIHDPQAEEKYTHILQEKFNQQRARQVASINQLEQAVSQPPSSAEPETISPEPQPQANSGYVSNSNLLMALFIVFLMVLLWLTRIKRLKKQGLNQQAKQRQYEQDQQLLLQSKTIKQQKQQLKRLFNQLQQLQKSHKVLQQQAHVPSTPPEPTNQTMSVACALLGYTPDTLPDNKTIKVRYKQLCKIYHPDMKGSDDEMKRLNKAVKYVLAQRR